MNPLETPQPNQQSTESSAENLNPTDKASWIEDVEVIEEMSNQYPVSQRIEDAEVLPEESVAPRTSEERLVDTIKQSSDARFEQNIIDSLFQIGHFKMMREKVEVKNIRPDQAGLGPERIRELLQTDEAVDKIKEGIVSGVSGAFNRAQDIYKNINDVLSEWKQEGANIELNDLMKTTTLPEVLKKQARSISSPEDFKTFSDDWVPQGLNIETIIPEIKSSREQQVTDQITVLLKKEREAIGSHERAMFADFLKKWKDAGVDLTELLNFEKITGLIQESQRLMSQTEFKPMVESWLKVGWKPSGPIMETLTKRAIRVK